MTGTTRTSADLDPRRRRTLYRSWHRGIREMDLIMGRFADAEIGDLSEAELDQFEALIEVPDRDLFKWLTGEVETWLGRRVEVSIDPSVCPARIFRLRPRRQGIPEPGPEG